MENVIERNKRLRTDEQIEAFRQKTLLSYRSKVAYAITRVRQYEEECAKRELNTHISVGGLDSITLLLFIRKVCDLDIPAVSVSCLEDKSIQRIHEQLGVEKLKPIKSKVNVIKEYGYTILSKEIANKINLLQNPTEQNKTVRHAIITGETGEYGGYRTGTRMKLSQKWLELFGGYENEAEGVNYKTPDFKVSDKCCYYLKEKPCDDWAKQHKSVPYLGLMASEGGRRAKSLMMNGCNYFGETTIRSCPFAIFSRQDLLQLAVDLDVPVPEIYGEIRKKQDGTLYTTKAQRTGCSMCGFGIQLEKRPHRFDYLRQSNPKEWAFWMYDQGWGHVLDYIGIEWENEIKISENAEQITFDDIGQEEARPTKTTCLEWIR